MVATITNELYFILVPALFRILLLQCLFFCHNGRVTYYCLSMVASNFSSIDPDVLTESKILREQEIGKSSVESTQKILTRVKSLYFAVWRDKQWMTNHQVASFYDVSVANIRSNYGRHKDEFIADGAILVEDDDLKDAKSVLGLNESSPKEVVFTLRAVLRMGFILRDSLVAAQVRTVALNIIEGVGKSFTCNEILDNFITGNPNLSNLVQSSGIAISSPLKDDFQLISVGQLKKSFPNGGIPGMSKIDIRDKMSALFTCIDIPGWEVKTNPEMSYKLDNQHYRYPDLSFFLPLTVDGVQCKAQFMFLIHDLIIDQKYVESVTGRNYITLGNKSVGIDYTFLYFVSPFGATPDAEAYIREYWPSEQERPCVGVLTVSELSEMLMKQAVDCKNRNFQKGSIKKDFNRIMQYEVPTALMVMAGYDYSSQQFV